MTQFLRKDFFFIFYSILLIYTVGYPPIRGDTDAAILGYNQLLYEYIVIPCKIQ